VTDPVRQQLAVREAGDGVVERAAPGGVEQARVVERDRGELGEANESVRLARAERPIVRPGREADHADRHAAGGQRDADDRAEVGGLEVGHPLRVGIVVGDHERGAGPVDVADQALVDRDVAAEQLREHAAAMTDGE